jgi:hypothetical protein
MAEIVNHSVDPSQYPDEVQFLPTLIGEFTSAIIRLDCMKTESFTYTIERNLDNAMGTVLRGAELGFPRNKRSFLVGIGDSTTAWIKEVSFARADGLESIVLFAVDQFCLIGYPAPLRGGAGKVLFQG